MPRVYLIPLIHIHTFTNIWLPFSDEETAGFWVSLLSSVSLFSPLEELVLSVKSKTTLVGFLLVQTQFYLSGLEYLRLLLLNFAVHFSGPLYAPQNAERRPGYFFICAITFVCALLQWLNIVLFCLNSTPASPKHFFHFLRTFLNASLQFTCDLTCPISARPMFYPGGNWNVFDMVCLWPVLAAAHVYLLEYFWLNLIFSKFKIKV